MTADFELEMTLMGEQDDIKNMLEVFAHYSNHGDREAYFIFIKLNGKSAGFENDEIDLKNITDELVADLSSSGEIKVSALGPYGRYVELNDVGLFREMAEVAPNGKFVAEISGSRGCGEQNLKCRLEAGKLNITTWIMSGDEPDAAWEEDFKDKLPLEKFKKLFAISGEGFDDESYESVVSELRGYSGCDFVFVFVFVEFDDFVSVIENNGGVTELDEDRYKEIFLKEFPALDIWDPWTFRSFYDGGVTNEYVYDPVAKAYEGKSKPLFDGTGVIDANDILAAGLRAQGLPDDEEALASLSIEEAYAALGAALGASDEDEENDEDEDEEE